MYVKWGGIVLRFLKSHRTIIFQETIKDGKELSTDTDRDLKKTCIKIGQDGEEIK